FDLVQTVFTTIPFVRSLANSTVVALSIGVGQALLCALAGYAFAKLRFRGREVLFVVVVLTMTVPMQLAIIPQYMIISNLGWLDSLQALIVPGLVNAFGIFWMRQHIAATISDELIQAARIDGCSSWQVFWRIVLPVVKPGGVRARAVRVRQRVERLPVAVHRAQVPDMYTVQIAHQAAPGQPHVDCAAIGG
ncbi:carbohydrate ABC transporter permease, partial [Agrobacterium sp. S2]|nr:carbohydrate ABC transporter permease [Agrobacterium sp. S2]